MRSFEAWKREQLKNPEFKAAYDALEEEFALIRALLDARTRAKLTQAQVARRMGTSQSAVARMESGRSLPSMSSLRKYAHATGSTVEIKLPKAKPARNRAARR
jgi:transcriptional regulator with XRE-family HTH domain